MIEDSLAQEKTTRPSAKLPRLFLFYLEISDFFLDGHHIDCPRSGSGSVFTIRIRIQGSHFNMDPLGSGSAS